MKKISVLMSLVLGALALTGCTSSDIESINNTKGAFSFTVNTDTRASIDGMNVVWQTGDKIALGAAQAGDTSTVAKEFTWVSGNTFSADTTYDSAVKYDFYAIFPTISKGLAFTTEKLVNPNAYSKYLYIGGKALNQKGQSKDSVMAYSPMYGTAKGVSAEGLNITLKHAAALLDFAIVNGTENPVTVKSVKMTMPTDFCGEYYVAYDGTLTPVKSYTYDFCQVNVSEGTAIATKGDAFHVYMPIAPVALKSGAQIDFTITTTDDKVCEISKTLTKAVEFEAGTISTQTLVFTGGSSITYRTLAQINASGLGTYDVKEATVYAVAGNNVVVGDGTANILVFKKSSGLKPGDIVSISGDVIQFDGVWEFSDPTVTKTGTDASFDRGTAVVYDAEKINDSKSDLTIEYTKFTGNYTSKTLLKVDTLSIYPYIASASDTVGCVGKKVDCYGYFIGFKTSSSKFSFVITSVNEVAVPKIALSSESASFESSDNGAGTKQTVTYTASNCTVSSVTCTDGSWLTFTSDLAGKSFSFYPTSANTGSARTATITVACSEGSQYNKTFTVTQKAASVGGEKTAVLTLKNGTTFGTKNPGTMKDDQDNTWTANCTSLQAWNTTYKGQQMGTKSTDLKATITADFTGKTIKSIEIIAAAGSAVPTYTIAVGSSTWKTGTLSTTATTYKAEGSASGVITITLDQKKAAKAVYFGGVTVVYTE